MMEFNSDKKSISFVFTNDGSVGLYDHDVLDIYHSSYGAKSEAEEKFIKSLNFEKNFKNKKNINVLDICFGIGYNTKAFLKKIIQTKYSGKIQIDALEYNKNLVIISPFVKDTYFDQYPQISSLIYKELYTHIYDERLFLKQLLKDNENKKFFTPFYMNLIKKYRFWGYKDILGDKLNSFLHNIYYHCISSRIKYDPKTLNYNKFNITPYFQDARATILALDKQYDIVFLDAFTPAKLPTLWSLEFFIELYRLISKDGILVTYSNSAAVRHAMLESCFYVGKIFDSNNRACGTIASKNKDLIFNKLDEFDIGLIKTNAGVYYKDVNLNSTAEEILFEHSERKKNSSLMSSSQYIKNYKKEHSHGKI